MRNSNMIIEFAVLSRFLKSCHMASLSLWLPLHLHRLWHRPVAALWWFFKLVKIRAICCVNRNVKKKRRWALSLKKSHNWMILFAVKRRDSSLQCLLLWTLQFNGIYKWNERTVNFKAWSLLWAGIRFRVISLPKDIGCMQHSHQTFKQSTFK